MEFAGNSSKVGSRHMIVVILMLDSTLRQGIRFGTVNGPLVCRGRSRDHIIWVGYSRPGARTHRITTRKITAPSHRMPQGRHCQYEHRARQVERGRRFDRTDMLGLGWGSPEPGTCTSCWIGNRAGGCDGRQSVAVSESMPKPCVVHRF